MTQPEDIALPLINPSATVHGFQPGGTGPMEPTPFDFTQFVTRGGDIATVTDWSGGNLLTFLENMIEGFFKHIVTALQGTFFSGLSAIEQPLTQFIKWWWDLFGDIIEAVLKPIFTWLGWLWKLFANITPNPEPTGPGADLLVPIFKWIDWLWELFGEAVQAVLKPIFTWLNWLWRLFANVPGPNPEPTGPGADILVPLFKWLDDLWEKIGATVLAAFNNLVQSVSSLISLPTLQNLIEKIAAAFTGVLNPQAFVDLLIQIINYFTSLFKTKSITDFTNSLPIIGPLVSAITGLTEKDGVALDFGTLGAFFRDLEKKATVSRSTLDDVANKVLGGILSIGMLNTTQPNLLSQGEFATADTVEAGGGWSWDNTVSATATGGSLLATATGSLQQMYSRQSIKVASGDKVTVSASVLTSGFTSGSMVLSIIPWIGTTQQATHVVATRTSSASTFQAMTGSTIIIGGTAGSGEIALPAGVTSIQVRLAVNANAGAKVWFDEIAVRKTGLVEQNWVTNLTDTWAKFWEGLVGSSGSGKTWADMFDAGKFLRLFANGTDTNLGTLSGNLLNTPAAVLGSIFGVKFDANNKTVADFLLLLFNKLNGSNVSTPKGVTDVGNAAGAVLNTANNAYTNAGTAQGAATVADNYAVLASAANNLVVDPDFTDTTIRRDANTFSTDYVSTPSREGNALRITSLYNFGAFPLGPTKLGGNPVFFPVVAGMVYKVDMWVQAASTNVGSGNLIADVFYFDINGTSYGNGSSSTPVASVAVSKGTWQHLTGTFTVPTYITGTIPVHTMVPVFTASSLVAGDVFYLDRVFVYQ